MRAREAVRIWKTLKVSRTLEVDRRPKDFEGKSDFLFVFKMAK